jgi:chromate transporter
MVSAIAWLYVTYRQLPQTGAVLYGVKPVVLAIVVQALIGLGQKAVKSWLLAVCGILAAVAALAEANALAILLVGGAAMMAIEGPRAKIFGERLVFVPGVSFATVGASAVTPFAMWPLFLFFLKTGSVLFGSGYVLLAFLRDDLVYRWHWLTEAQLLDAIAVGQITPGPVFTTATFIGYLLGGMPGAVVATVGIFLPAFMFVAISGPLVPRLRKSKLFGQFLDGVNVASLALMGAVVVQLAQAAVMDWATLALATVSLAMLYWKRVNSVWLMMAGALVGLAVKAGW